MDRPTVGLPKYILQGGRRNTEPCGQLVDRERVGQVRYHILLHLPHRIGQIVIAGDGFRRHRQQRTVCADEVQQLNGFDCTVGGSVPLRNGLQCRSQIINPHRAAQHYATQMRSDAGFDSCCVDCQTARCRCALLDEHQLTAEQSVRDRKTLHTCAEQQQYLVLLQEHLPPIGHGQPQTALPAEQHLARHLGWLCRQGRRHSQRAVKIAHAHAIHRLGPAYAAGQRCTGIRFEQSFQHCNFLRWYISVYQVRFC